LKNADSAVLQMLRPLRRFPHNKEFEVVVGLSQNGVQGTAQQSGPPAGADDYGGPGGHRATLSNGGAIANSGGVMKLCARVVDPELDADLPMWGDASDGWASSAFDWVGKLAAAGVPFTGSADPVADDGAGVLITPSGSAGFRTGRRPHITGPPPDSVEATLDLLASALGAVVLPDLRGVLVLRLDDPGAAVKRYLESWRHPDVSDEAWDALWETLATAGGRASIFCSTAWVRPDGEVVSSRDENPAEWRALDRGVALGVAELECHGHTHMDPDTHAWARAPDRFSADHWFRELCPPRRSTEPSVDEQASVLRSWQTQAGIPGTTLVAPGEAWGRNTVPAARACGFDLFNSWGLCRLQLPVPTWTRHVGSPYLDQPTTEPLQSGVPTVGYWHDRDMAVHGPDWAPRRLAAWREAGATRLWSFSQLAHAYGELSAHFDAGAIEVEQAPAGVPLRVIRG
jgi:hypothetical protein